LVDRSKIPKDNDIVIAQVGNEWTLKYLIKRPNKTIILRPANKEYKDIHPEEEVQIGGVVMSVIRKY